MKLNCNNRNILKTYQKALCSIGMVFVAGCSFMRDQRIYVALTVTYQGKSPVEVQIEGKKQIVTQSGDLLVPSGTHLVTLSNGTAHRNFRYKLGPDSEAYWFINESPLRLMGDGVEAPN